MKLHLPKRRRYRIYLYLLSILIILFALDLVLVRIGRHITIAKDTTYITSPLKPDGTPDYVQAIDDIYSAGITDDNNAARLLLPLYGLDNLTQSNADDLVARLHLPTPAAFPHVIVQYGVFLQSRHVTEATLNAEVYEAEDSSKQPWDPAAHPDLAAWIADSSPALAVLQEAVQRPRYYLPCVLRANALLIDQRLPGVNACRWLAYAACARAMLRARAGDIDGARADLLAIHRLSRLITQRPFIIEGLSGAAMDRISNDATITLAQSGRLTPGQSRLLLADLRALPPFPSIDNSFNTERDTVLDLLVYASRHGPAAAINIFTGNAEPLSRAFNFLPINLDAALRQTNVFFDRMIDADHASSYGQTLALNHDIEHDLNALDHVRAHGLFFPGQKLIAMFIPDLNNIPKLYAMQSTSLHLAQLALALSAYHADHHAYPPTLAPLSPDYLPQIPEDLFINQPLHYALTSTGYLLYSVGPNMQDDAGQTRQHHDPAHPHADDLIITVP